MVAYVTLFGMWAWCASPHNLLELLNSEYYKYVCWILLSMVIADAGKSDGRQVIIRYLWCYEYVGVCVWVF